MSLHEQAVGATRASVTAWYVLTCRTGAELDIVDALAEIQIEGWCPCETRWSRSRRKRMARRVPLLGGYVFVALDDCYPPFVACLMVEGVMEFLGGAQPRQVSYAGALADLRAREEAGAFDLTRDPAAGRAARKATEKVRVLAELPALLARDAASPHPRSRAA